MPSEDELLYRATLDVVSDEALSMAEVAWQRSQHMGPKAREEFLAAALAEISVAYGDVAADSAVDYLRTVAVASAVDLAPVAANEEQIAVAVAYSLQTQREGLADPVIVATLQPRIRGVVLKLVRLRAHDTIDRAAEGLGRERTVRHEPGACGYCLGRTTQGAKPPYHDGCRCDVVLE